MVHTIKNIIIDLLLIVSESKKRLELKEIG